jgi:hypothetical protein
MAPNLIHVEQQTGYTLVCQSCLERGEGVRLESELCRQSLVFGERPRDEFRKSDRMKQACGNPPHVDIARAGDHGQSDPQRFARGGVRIVGGRIQKNVGETMAGEVVFVPRQAARKDDPFTIDPARSAAARRLVTASGGLDMPPARHITRSGTPSQSSSKMRFRSCGVDTVGRPGRREGPAFGKISDGGPP